MNKTLQLFAWISLIFMQSGFGQIINPEFIYSDASDCKILKIERGSYSTAVYFKYMASSHYTDGGWVCAGPNFFIRDRDTNIKYKLQKPLNIPICPEKYYFKKAGEALEFNLLFDALPPTTNKIDIIEDETTKGFNFYGVSLSEKTTNVSTNSENTPSTEEEFKKYIMTHLEDYDPIVGIYSIGGYEEKSLQGNITYKGEVPVSEYKSAIIRKGSKFYLYNLPAKQNRFIELKPTSTNGTYIMDGEKVSINSQGAILNCSYLTPQEVANNIKGTIEDVVRFQIQIYYCIEYIKVFPTDWDLQQIIKEKEKNAPATGTGFALSSDGYIVTNYHVIDNANSIKVKGINGNFTSSLNASIVVSDKNNDLAILKINEQSFNSLGTIPYTIKNAASEVGESVFVLGYPLTASMGEEIKLTNGIISSKSGFQGDITTYQTTAAVQPGNSGAPMFDSEGNIIGIINSKHTQAENAGYAIKTNYLQNLIDMLPVKPKQSISNLLKGKGLSEQVKSTKNFIYIIEIN